MLLACGLALLQNGELLSSCCQEVGQPISPVVVGDFAAARGRAPQVLEELVVAVRLRAGAGADAWRCRGGMERHHGGARRRRWARWH